MTNYMFETTTTMKEYNREKWWIDGDIIRPTIIAAENLKAALRAYKQYCDDKYIEISENALRTKQAMYVDLKSGGTKQVGYVITGKTVFYDDYNRHSEQYVDLWVRISIVNDVDFTEN